MSHRGKCPLWQKGSYTLRSHVIMLCIIGAASTCKAYWTLLVMFCVLLLSIGVLHRSPVEVCCSIDGGACEWATHKSHAYSRSCRITCAFDVCMHHWGGTLHVVKVTIWCLDPVVRSMFLMVKVTIVSACVYFCVHTSTAYPIEPGGLICTCKSSCEVSQIDG